MLTSSVELCSINLFAFSVQTHNCLSNHYNKVCLQVLSSDVSSGTEAEEEDDGMNDLNHEVMSLIWSEDLRVQDVRRLLQSAQPVRVNVVQYPELSDHEFIEEKENR